MSERERTPRGLLVIAAFKLLKGLALLAVGIGAHTLINKDAAAILEHWVNVFRVDPNNQYLHALLERIADLNPHRLMEAELRHVLLCGAAADGRRWAGDWTNGGPNISR